ncbi:MAG: hypothetical protein J6A01_04800, partial [Proteobacteria bacterium]|nr:hypothetical protein [Pseudomonadota bacterium]
SNVSQVYTKDIGNIKGNSVTVDNIEAVSDNAGGLLGYDDSSANINADSMTFKQVSGRKYVGGLAGHYRGSGLILVKNISVETLSGTEEIGGMIGRSENGVLQIDSAHVDNGSITCTKSCGGVIGYFTNKQFLLSNIECNTKKISGENELGGFAGTVSFDISNLITEFKQISTHTESILLTRTTNAEDYAGGFIGVMKLGANNDTDFVRFSNIISSVDLLDSKHFTAGFLGHVYRGGDKKYRQIMMNDILSIVYNFNDPASVESNPAGLFSVVQKHIHINAKNVVSIAVLPESARIHALFALFDGEERFAPENVYWYQFGGYSDNTKLTAEAVTEVNNITNENVDQIVDKLNASGNSKWEVKTDAEFSGQKYNIPWLSL